MKHKKTAWRESEIDYLKIYYHRQSIEQTMLVLGRSKKSIQSKASQIFSTKKPKVKKITQCIICNSVHYEKGEYCKYCKDCIYYFKKIKSIVNEMLKKERGN